MKNGPKAENGKIENGPRPDIGKIPFLSHFCYFGLWAIFCFSTKIFPFLAFGRFCFYTSGLARKSLIRHLATKGVRQKESGEPATKKIILSELFM